MQSRLERYRQPKKPRWVRVLGNIGALAVLFVSVLALSNWMAPNVLRWLTATPVKNETAEQRSEDERKSSESNGVTQKEKEQNPKKSDALAVSVTASPAPAATASPVPDKLEGDTVRMRFVGDILLGSRVGDFMDEKGSDYPYRYVRNTLSDADFTMGNMEAPVTDGGTAQMKAYVFKVNSKHLPALKEVGFDAMTLANNHTYDYGERGLLDTMDAFKALDFPYVGAGRNKLEAYAPHVFEKNGMKVAVFGFSRVLPTIGWAAEDRKSGLAQVYDTKYAAEAIRRWRGLADLIVVYNHWGVERSLEPKPYQPKLARDLIDAGADLIIGSHPHVVQGVEQYNGKWIVYSLGNFIFTTSGSQYTNDSAVVEAVCNRERECRLKMMPLKIIQAQPQFVDAVQSAEILKRIDEYSMKMGARVYPDGRIEAVQAGTTVTP